MNKSVSLVVEHLDYHFDFVLKIERVVVYTFIFNLEPVRQQVQLNQILIKPSQPLLPLVDSIYLSDKLLL